MNERRITKTFASICPLPPSRTAAASCALLRLRPVRHGTFTATKPSASQGRNCQHHKVRRHQATTNDKAHRTPDCTSQTHTTRRNATRRDGPRGARRCHGNRDATVAGTQRTSFVPTSARAVALALLLIRTAVTSDTAAGTTPASSGRKRLRTTRGRSDMTGRTHTAQVVHTLAHTRCTTRMGPMHQSTRAIHPSIHMRYGQASSHVSSVSMHVCVVPCIFVCVFGTFANCITHVRVTINENTPEPARHHPLPRRLPLSKHG